MYGERLPILSLPYMKDFKPGPLREYRVKASFDWKQMRIYLDGEDILRFKVFCQSNSLIYTKTDKNGFLLAFYLRLEMLDINLYVFSVL